MRWFLYFFVVALNVYLCYENFHLARKKNLDPWKWVKYTLFCGVFASFYLVLYREEDSGIDHPDDAGE